MNAPNSDESLPADPHADKYNDPRVQVSRRGVLLGVAVVIFGVAGAALSIWARKTSLVKTRAFWGDETIEALQLAEEFELILVGKKNEDGSPLAAVRLSGMPGLGHLRHTLLDDRSYLWETERTISDSAAKTGEEPAIEPASSAASSAEQMVLRLSDPTANRFPEARLRLFLEEGWIGPDGGEKQVQLNERFRQAVPSFLRRVANFEPLHLDARRQKQDALLQKQNELTESETE